MTELRGSLAPKTGILPENESPPRTSTLRGSLVGTPRPEETRAPFTEKADFIAFISVPGTKFESAERSYEVIRYDESGRFVNTKMTVKSGSLSATANPGIDNLWEYYQEGRIWFN